MTNYEIIRNACIKANPQILELGFGCEVKCIDKQLIHDYFMVGNGLGYRGCVLWDIKEPNTPIGHKRFDNRFIFSEKENMFEILGRPIRLADVLLAVQNNYEFFEEKYRRDVVNLLDCWNLLKDNLADNPQTWDFLAELLK